MKYNNNHLLTTGMLSALSCLLIPSPVYAQSSSFLLEEIVVTARKRDESAQDIPIAIAAFSAAKLKGLGVREAADIALSTPNFTWNTEFGRSTPQPYLRGVGTNNFNAINAGPIAVYQDHVVIGPNIVQGLSAFDLERVEVLKGPQSTLYGRNSTGGLINFISKKPEIGAGTTGFINAELGRFETTNFEGAVGFDLGDKAAARIAVERNLNQGSFSNENPAVDDDKVGSIDDVGLRVGVLFEPSEELSILTNFHYAESNTDTAPFKFIGLQDPNGPNANVAFPGFTPDLCPNPGVGSGCTDLFTGAVTGVSGLHSTSKSADFEDTRLVGGFVKIDYELSDTLSLQSITSYDESELRRLDDADDTIVALELDHYNDDFEAFSQEVRLTSASNGDIGWNLGVYYYDESNEGTTFFSNPIFGSGFGNVHAIDTKSYAIFGQVDWAATDEINVSAGLRWTYEEKDVRQYDSFARAVPATLSTLVTSTAGAPASTIVSGTTGSTDFNEITGGITIDYTTDSGNLLYASISRGVKGGDLLGAATIFNPALAPVTADQITVFEIQTQVTDPEILDAFEIGYKSDWLDSKLRVNGAVFFYIYKDQQQTVLQPDPTGVQFNIATLTANTRSELPGAEVELTYTPTDRWFLNLNMGYVDAEYDEFVNPVAGAPDFSGNDVSLTPDFDLAALGRYEIPLDNGSALALQMEVTHHTSTFFQPQNDTDFASAQLQEGDVTLLNARISYTNESWSFAVFGKNLADKEYLGSGFQIGGLGYAAVKPGPQRYYGAEIGYDF